MKARVRNLEVARAPDPIDQKQIEADAELVRSKLKAMAAGFDDSDAILSPERWAGMSIASQMAWKMRFPEVRHTA